MSIKLDTRPVCVSGQWQSLLLLWAIVVALSSLVDLFVHHHHHLHLLFLFSLHSDVVGARVRPSASRVHSLMIIITHLHRRPTSSSSLSSSPPPSSPPHRIIIIIPSSQPFEKKPLALAIQIRVHRQPRKKTIGRHSDYDEVSSWFAARFDNQSKRDNEICF